MLDRPKIFYHGTQTAIHLTNAPYLDPKYATGGDEGDPSEPHVFITPHLLFAKIFALKTQNAVSTGIGKRMSHIIFSIEPTELKGGWVYTCEENQQRPFEEIVVRGRPTGKWVGYDKTTIHNPQYVADIETLMLQDNLQVFVLKDGMDLKKWAEDSRNVAYSGRQEAFYAEQIRLGNLRHLNAERGINPIAPSPIDDRPIAPAMQTALAQITTPSNPVVTAQESHPSGVPKNGGQKVSSQNPQL